MARHLFKTGLILVAAVTLSSCAAMKRSSATVDHRTEVLDVREVRELSDGRTDNEDRSYFAVDIRDREESRTEVVEPVMVDEPYPAYDISFSGLETEHVKYSYYEPFGEEGLIELDLDVLARNFTYPLAGKFISDYGYRGRSYHTGVDIKAAPRDTIRSAFDGVVRLSKPYSSYGNIVMIRHYNGLETLYSHNTQNLVKAGDVVSSGQPIALAGRTGRATTEHLHFEVRVKGQHFDPKLLIDPDNQVIRKGKLYVYNQNGTVVASNTAKDESGRQALLADGSPSAPGVPAPSQDAVAGDPVYYRVKKGDTLSAIAQRHKTTVNNICRLNNIKSTSLLQINQRLRVK